MKYPCGVHSLSPPRKVGAYGAQFVRAEREGFETYCFSTPFPFTHDKNRSQIREKGFESLRANEAVHSLSPPRKVGAYGAQFVRAERESSLSPSQKPPSISPAARLNTLAHMA